MGVSLRRRFGFAHGELTAYEDEDLTRASVPETSAILESEIERPVLARCATSSPPSSPSKTASFEQTSTSHSAFRCTGHGQDSGRSASRRVSALRLPRSTRPLRRARRRSQRQLPVLHRRRAAGLGRDRRQATAARWSVAANRVSVRGFDTVPAALIKGDARMADVLRRAVWSHLGAPSGALVPRGAHQWRVGGYLVEEMMAELRRRGVRYEAGRAMLPQRLAHQVLLRMEAWVTRPTTACRTPWPAADRCGRTPTPCGRHSIRPS